MSNLCYNCCNTHLGALPKQCGKPLVECLICHNMGHQHLFCPKGWKSFDDKAELYAVCHNCGMFHLPLPCQQDMVQCNRCNHYGHLPSFCPVDPPRPVEGYQNGHVAVNVSQVHPELLRNIRMDACFATLRSLETQTKEQILARMQATASTAHPNAPFQRNTVPPTSNPAAAAAAAAAAPPGQHQHTGQLAQAHQSNSDGDGVPRIITDSSIPAQAPAHLHTKPQHPRTSPKVPPTPYPNPGQHAARNDSVVSNTLKRSHGDSFETAAAEPLVNGNAAGNEGQTAPKKTKSTKTKADTTKAVNTKADKGKGEKAKGDQPKRRPPQPRCADCKKRHRRCDHGSDARDVANNMASSPSTQTTKTPGGVLDERQSMTATPDGAAEPNSAVVRLPVPQSGSGVADQVIQESTSEQQQEMLHPATVATPPTFQHMEAQNLQYYQGNEDQSNWLARSAQHAMSGQHGMADSTAAVEHQDFSATASHNTNTGQDGHLEGFQPRSNSFDSNGQGVIQPVKDWTMQQFKPQSQPIESNGQTWVAHGTAWDVRQQQPMHSGVFNQQQNQMPTLNSTFAPAKGPHLGAPNHHNDGSSVFAFDEDGRVVDSVEEHTSKDGQGTQTMQHEGAGMDGLGAKASSGGRPREASE